MKTRNGYSRLQIGIHWAIALLIGAQFLLGDSMEAAFAAVSKGQTYDAFLPSLHVYTGLTVLGLVALRLLLRYFRGVPDTPPTSSPRMEIIGEWTHWGLLGLLFLVPLSGMAAWGAGIAIAGGFHGLFVNLLMSLAFLHAAAALYHQYVIKDNLLRRMMKPG